MTGTTLLPLVPTVARGASAFAANDEEKREGEETPLIPTGA
jgi:hypothetical protein